MNATVRREGWIMCSQCGQVRGEVVIRPSTASTTTTTNNTQEDDGIAEDTAVSSTLTLNENPLPAAENIEEPTLASKTAAKPNKKKTSAAKHSSRSSSSRASKKPMMAANEAPTTAPADIKTPTHVAKGRQLLEAFFQRTSLWKLSDESKRFCMTVWTSYAERKAHIQQIEPVLNVMLFLSLLRDQQPVFFDDFLKQRYADLEQQQQHTLAPCDHTPSWGKVLRHLAETKQLPELNVAGLTRSTAVQLLHGTKDKDTNDELVALDTWHSRFEQTGYYAAPLFNETKKKNELVVQKRPKIRVQTIKFFVRPWVLRAVLLLQLIQKIDNRPIVLHSCMTKTGLKTFDIRRERRYLLDRFPSVIPENIKMESQSSSSSTKGEKKKKKKKTTKRQREEDDDDDNKKDVAKPTKMRRPFPSSDINSASSYAWFSRLFVKAA